MSTTKQTVTIKFQDFMMYMKRLSANSNQIVLHGNDAMQKGGAEMKVRIDDDFGYLEAVNELRDGLRNGFFTTDITEEAVNEFVTDSQTYYIDVEGSFPENQFHIAIREAESQSFMDCLSQDENGVHYTPRAYNYVPKDEILEALEQLAEKAYVL